MTSESSIEPPIRFDAGDGSGPLSRLLVARALTPVFQPIAELTTASVHAHEALIRGPAGMPLRSPDALLAAASREGLLLDFEIVCLVTILEHWARMQCPGRLFVNISASALIATIEERTAGRIEDVVKELGILPRMLVLEITEHERVDDMSALLRVAEKVHSAGISLALDDFGDGRSSLRLWSEVKPKIVKIDKYFTKNLSRHGDKLQTLRALMQIADVFGTALVAEGIETEEELRILRDLGIDFGQGYFLGRPSPEPRTQLEPNSVCVLEDRRVAVFPEATHQPSVGPLRRLDVIRAETISPTTTNNEVAKIFAKHENFHALAIVEVDSKPVGLINRHQFMEKYAQIYFKEIYGNTSCLSVANTSPRLVERASGIDEMLGILTSQDQRYLTDGIIMTENGRYIGLGSGDQLVRAVTESRIDAARHANPLTFLPGNIPISQHMQRLLDSGTSFTACYADLNSFKPFNDHYGYWRGDEMIVLAARLCASNCDSQRDFVGHVGGDDFFMLFQSSDWVERCERIAHQFNRGAQALFDDEARTAGGISAEDRYGVTRFFSFTTMSIGAVPIAPNQFTRPEHVANEAALAKHIAKLNLATLFVREPTPLLGDATARSDHWLDTRGAPLSALT